MISPDKAWATKEELDSVVDAILAAASNNQKYGQGQANAENLFGLRMLEGIMRGLCTAI